MPAIYPLHALLTARKRRLDEASAVMRHASDEVARCHRTLTSARKKLVDYQAWRIQETDLRWKKCLGNNMRLRELDDFRASLAELEQGELACVAAVDEAAKVLAESESALQQAKAHYNEASRKLEKLQEHQKYWLREQEKEEDRLAENEMEEFRRLIRETSTQDDLELELAAHAN